MLHGQGRAILPYLTHYLPRYLLMQDGQAMFLRSGVEFPKAFGEDFDPKHFGQHRLFEKGHPKRQTRK